MQPRELAVLLNVSQGQIVRHLEQRTTPTEYQLDCWRREMRSAEMWLREWSISGDTPTSVEKP